MPEPPAEGDRARRLSEPRAGGASAAEPTLPELLAAGWRRAGPLGRTAGLAIVFLVVLAAILFLLGRGGGELSYDGPEAPPFSISWTELERAAAEEGELLRLESDLRERLVIAPLAFDSPGPGNEPLPALGIEADQAGAGIRTEYEGARIVLEGRTLLAVDRGPEAYQLAFTAPTDGGEGIVIGKHFLVPDPDRPGEGVEIEIVEETSDPAVIEKVERAPAGFFLNWPIQLLLEDAVSVRTEEGLEEPLRSFAFG